MGDLSPATCYAALLEHWPHGLYEVDRDGSIQVINRVGLDWLGGVPREEAVGKRYLELVVEEDRDRVQTFLDRAFEGYVGDRADLNRGRRGGPIDICTNNVLLET